MGDILKESKTFGNGPSGLRNEIVALRRLIESYLSSGKPLPPYLQLQLPKLRALTASWNRIMQRIESGERERLFLRRVEGWTPRKGSFLV